MDLPTTLLTKIDNTNWADLNGFFTREAATLGRWAVDRDLTYGSHLLSQIHLMQQSSILFSARILAMSIQAETLPECCFQTYFAFSIVLLRQFAETTDNVVQDLYPSSNTLLTRFILFLLL